MNDYSSKLIKKKEIMKIYNDDNENNGKDNTFLMELDPIKVDIDKIKKVFSSSKKLILEIVSSDDGEDKLIQIEIDPFGYVNSKREKDGITYFGYQNEENLGIDYIFKYSENFDDYNFNGKYFMIKFDPDDLNYYIQDCGKGCGTFIKIQEWTEIKNNLLLNIGENYIVFSTEIENEEKLQNIINNINNDDINNETCLYLKIFSMKEQKIFTIKSENCPVTIGRNSDNNIVIDDDMLSRNHCTIDFYNGKWYIQDGYAKNGLQEEEIKKSTNGSWIYAFDEIKIKDKMIFKANRNIFICNLV